MYIDPADLKSAVELAVDEARATGFHQYLFAQSDVESGTYIVVVDEPAIDIASKGLDAEDLVLIVSADKTNKTHRRLFIEIDDRLVATAIH